MSAGALLRIDVLTIFPSVVDAYCEASILGRARREGTIDVQVHDLRAAARDPHRSVDDAPFGGGAGMVLAPEPVFAAVEQVDPPRPLLLLSPGGFGRSMGVQQLPLHPERFGIGTGQVAAVRLGCHMVS